MSQRDRCQRRGAPPGARDLLRWSVAAASRSVQAAAGADPRSSTPCSEWDLSVLVRHVADSARSLRGLLEDRPITAVPPAGCAAALRELDALAEAVAGTDPAEPGHDLIALTSAYELAVHAWDVSEAAGHPADLSSELVGALLVYAPHALAGVVRDDLFGEQVPPGDTVTDLDRLLGLFGRRRRP